LFSGIFHFVFYGSVNIPFFILQLVISQVTKKTFVFKTNKNGRKLKRKKQVATKKVSSNDKKPTFVSKKAQKKKSNRKEKWSIW
jgi:hypothetical protein